MQMTKSFRNLTVMKFVKSPRCGRFSPLLGLMFASTVSAACDPVFQHSRVPTPTGFYLCSASGLFDQQYQPILTKDIAKLEKNAFDYGQYNYQGEIELTGIISKFEYEAYGVIILFTAANDDAAKGTPAETRLEEYTRQRTFEFHDVEKIDPATLSPVFNDHGWCATATVKVSKLRIDVQDTDGIFGPIMTEYKVLKKGTFEKCPPPKPLSQ